MLQESFLTTTICCLINLLFFRSRSYGEVLNTIASITLLAILCVVPFVIRFSLQRNYHFLDTKGFRNTFGSLYDGIKIAKEVEVVTFITYFYYRRLICAVTVVLIDAKLVFQIYSFLVTTLIKLVILFAVKPYASSYLNFLEKSNELLMMLIIY